MSSHKKHHNTNGPLNFDANSFMNFLNSVNVDELSALLSTVKPPQDNGDQDNIEDSKVPENSEEEENLKNPKDNRSEVITALKTVLNCNRKELIEILVELYGISKISKNNI